MSVNVRKDDFENLSENNPICPWCYRSISEYGKERADEGEIACDHCGKLFLYSKFIRTTYATKRKE